MHDPLLPTHPPGHTQAHTHTPRPLRCSQTVQLHTLLSLIDSPTLFTPIPPLGGPPQPLTFQPVQVDARVPHISTPPIYTSISPPAPPPLSPFNLSRFTPGLSSFISACVMLRFFITSDSDSPLRTGYTLWGGRGGGGGGAAGVCGQRRTGRIRHCASMCDHMGCLLEGAGARGVSEQCVQETRSRPDMTPSLPLSLSLLPTPGPT